MELILQAFFFRQHSFGVIGNTIVGVFASIFFIKIFGRLGFDPVSIMLSGDMNIMLLIINIIVSLCSGAIGLIAAKIIIKKLNKT